MDIGLTLKALRKAKRLTQQEVADHFGVSRATISNYEIGRRRPSFKEMQAFAEFFGVSIEHFGIHSSTKDELTDLLARAEKVFMDQEIPQEKKESVYRELMRLYLELGGAKR